MELLRIFINESDQWEGRPLYKAIVEKMRKAHMAGCTVFRGAEGFGESGRLRDARFDVLFLDLPVIIEAVDAPERIDAIAPALGAMIKVGMMTRETVDVKMYRAKPPQTP